MYANYCLYAFDSNGTDCFSSNSPEMLEIAKNLFDLVAHKRWDEKSCPLNKWDLQFCFDPTFEIIGGDIWLWEDSTEDMKKLAETFPEYEFVLWTTDESGDEWREHFKDDKYAISYCRKVFDAAPTWSNTSFESVDE